MACEKALTKTWLKTEVPTINEWIDIVYKMYTMERIAFRLRTQAVFEDSWFKWLTYVSNIRPDFV